MHQRHERLLRWQARRHRRVSVEEDAVDILLHLRNREGLGDELRHAADVDRVQRVGVRQVLRGLLREGGFREFVGRHVAAEHQQPGGLVDLRGLAVLVGDGEGLQRVANRERRGLRANEWQQHQESQEHSLHRLTLTKCESDKARRGPCAGLACPSLCQRPPAGTLPASRRDAACGAQRRSAKKV